MRDSSRFGKGGVYAVEAEAGRAAEALRERFGDDHELLRPGAFRGTLWIQATAWALGYDDERRSRNERDATIRE